ncbi:MAG: hypothetical protein AAB439_00095 [Patescibacteria group bacterium]
MKNRAETLFKLAAIVPLSMMTMEMLNALANYTGLRHAVTGTGDTSLDGSINEEMTRRGVRQPMDRVKLLREEKERQRPSNDNFDDDDPTGSAATGDGTFSPGGGDSTGFSEAPFVAAVVVMAAVLALLYFLHGRFRHVY